VLGNSKDISKAVIAMLLVFAVLFGGTVYYLSTAITPITATGIFAPAAGSQSSPSNSSVAAFTLTTSSTQTLTAGSVVCGGTAPSTGVVSVGMTGGAAKPFTPQTVTVVIGVNNTVTWTNNDPAAVPHTVTSNDGLFNSNTLTGPFTCTFLSPGTYNYRCYFHPLMVGVVVVKSH
jgi:plastocyanin